MLFNKWTFSLLSLVVLIAFGLICVVPSVLANDGDTAHVKADGTKGNSKTAIHADVEVTLSAAESMMDVSYRGGDDSIQIMRRADTESTIQLLAKFSTVVHLDDPKTTAPPDTGADEREGLEERTGAFEIADVVIDAYDEKGRALGILPTTAETVDVLTISHRDPNNPGKEFLIQIDEALLVEAYTTVRGGGASLVIGTLIVSIPPESVQDATLSEVIRQRKGEHEPHWNKVSNIFQIDFVMADAGEAKYHTFPLAATPTYVEPGTPGVVSIDRILDRSAFSPIETGPFNVRVILTEEPRMGDESGLTTDMIQVDVVGSGGGSATAVVAGLTFDGAATDADPPVRSSGDLTLPIVGTYTTLGDAASADPAASTDATTLPDATGRDNKYYTYSVTITPDAGTDGDLIISIKSFMDHVKPVSNQYLPLSAEQRVATTLGTEGTRVRDARLANETLTVKVNSAADSKVEAATAAYKTRKEEVLDKVANDYQLANKTYIPAGGYLVLTRDVGKAGITATKVKTKERAVLTPAQQMYNTHGLFDNNLDDLFRNGATLNLAYADIPEATGSGHDDSKGATGDDATGYTAADSTAYAAGALIINEIMWGLDSGTTDSQYIELYNPGDTAIGIDNMEWIITIGSVPTGFTIIDTVSNVPASGYWAAPGNGGVTAVSAEHPAVVDLASMSRLMDAAGAALDGTMASSWATSMRPSKNLAGRRIGTPGAQNMPYMMEAVVEPEPTPEPMADVATGSDIMISEIMVASNEGRLPQWIELANVSAGEVSLSGWMIEVDNDPDDADVVSETVRVNIGNVTVGEDQVVLIVSKTSTRNSGTGMGPDAEGTLREDRIVDVQSQVSADDARYSLISEMAFKISLIPPQTGGAVERGDVVGNLGQGWELPMSEVGRSSLIRREMGKTAAIMGTDAAGWVLASGTELDGAYRTTYYGDDEDVGTPGYNAGGALPVELSKFSAARDKVTGQVTIAWETQSELNNAGFFIKRSQQRNGNFVVVNPTMVPGAGTTAEKQSYTYTDTTAQPNIVYYYQIEDVSLDGNRQTLTRGHRLKGHIGAAGKVTTTWGDLKSSRE